MLLFFCKEFRLVSLNKVCFHGCHAETVHLQRWSSTALAVVTAKIKHTEIWTICTTALQIFFLTTWWSGKKIPQHCYCHTMRREPGLRIFSVSNFCHHSCPFHTVAAPQIWIPNFKLVVVRADILLSKCLHANHCGICSTNTIISICCRIHHS